MIAMNAIAKSDLEIQVQQLKAQLVEAEQLILDLRREGSSKCDGLVQLSKAHLKHQCSPDDFNVDLLKENGWTEACPELIPANEHLAILRYENHPAGKAELLILFPGATSSPIHVYVDGAIEIS